MLRILTIDDHAVVRKGVKALFANRPGTVAFGEASSVPEAIKSMREEEWDIVVLDITLGDRSGLDLMKELRVIRPGVPILVLSMHSEAQYARRAFKAGASGYITKDTIPDELLKAIHRVAAGGKYVSPEFAESLVTDVDAGVSKEPHERLSDRELEILLLIASGKTVSEIGELLCRSVKTISTYRTRILEKMNLRTNAELTHYAIHKKLVE